MSSTDKEKIISGEKLIGCSTLGSMYDMNSFKVVIGNNSYRLDVSDLEELLRRQKFKAYKKRVHTYLIPVLD